MNVFDLLFPKIHPDLYYVVVNHFSSVFPAPFSLVTCALLFNFFLEKASPQISGLSRSMRLSSDICGLGFLRAKLAQLELANLWEILLKISLS